MYRIEAAFPSSLPSSGSGCPPPSRAGRWLAMALAAGISSLTLQPSAPSASTVPATSALAVALPAAPADGDVSVVLVNPADAPVSALVSTADRRGVLLTDALARAVTGRERVGLFAPDLQADAASVRVEADGPLRGAVVARGADGAILDSQLVAGEGATTVSFLIAPGTAASTAIAVLNTGVFPT